jgi:Ion channel
LAKLDEHGVHTLWTIFLDRPVQRYWGGRSHPHFMRDRFLPDELRRRHADGCALPRGPRLALFYDLADVAPESTDPVYFVFVNLHTLGYGDVVPVRSCGSSSQSA